MTTDVFVSYSRKNTEVARDLTQRLTQKGKDVWADWEDIPKTSPNWWQEIKLGIENTDSFLFIISPDSMASVVCNMELDYARELKKRIIPVVYIEVASDTPFASIEDYKPDAGMKERLQGKEPHQMAQNNWIELGHINWVFFRETDDQDKAFTELIDAIDRDIEYVRAHTRYLTRALEWQRANKPAHLLIFGDEIDQAEAWLAKGEQYALEAEQNKQDKDKVVNSLPKEEHKTYIEASRRADKRRRRQVRAARWSIGVLILVALLAFYTVGDTVEDMEIAQSTGDAAQITAQFANQQVAAIVPTLTQAVIISEISGEIAQINMELMEGEDTTSQQRADALVSIYPEEPYAWLANGLFYDRTGNYALALAAYNEAISIDPDYALAYYNRGLLFQNNEYYDMALTNYEQAIALDPERYEAYTNIGFISLRRQEWDAAITALDQAIAISPGFSIAYNNRALAYTYRENDETPLDDYRQALDDWQTATDLGFVIDAETQAIIDNITATLAENQ